MNEEKDWHKAARWAFLTSLFVVWPYLFALFWASVSAHNNGVKKPDVEHTIRSTQHGNTVYITTGDWRRKVLLGRVVVVGLPREKMKEKLEAAGASVNIK